MIKILTALDADSSSNRCRSPLLISHSLLPPAVNAFDFVGIAYRERGGMKPPNDTQHRPLGLASQCELPRDPPAWHRSTRWARYFVTPASDQRGGS